MKAEGAKEFNRESLLWHAVECWAARCPDKEALVNDAVRLTWRDFQRQVEQIALGLLELGVKPGDRVAMLSMACVEFLPVFLATSRIGAIWVGISPRSTLSELRFLIGDCRPMILISLRKCLGRDLTDDLETLRREFPDLRRVLVLGESFDDFVFRERPGLESELRSREANGQPDDAALLLYTSGSTGKPKGVVHTHGTIIRNAAVQVAQFGFDEHSKALLHFPINHVAAVIETGFASVYAGATIVLMDRFDPAQSLRVIEQEQITVVGQVPTMFLMQFQTPAFRSVDLSQVRSFIWAGSTAPRRMIEVLGDISRKTGARLITGYGSTEVGGFVTYSASEDDWETLATTAGRIVPPFELRIVDDARCEVTDGSVGEIALHGPMLMRGYFGNPEATAAVVDREGWYYSGDLAWKDARGYIHIVGRKSEMYKSGGENIYPREIEEVLEAHPAVLFTAVIGVPDPLYQEVGHAFIMLKPGIVATEEQLRTHCQQHLARFKIPKNFEMRPQLPMLPTGKVDKVRLMRELNEM